MAVKKKGEPRGRLGNQGYQEGNEGREHDNAEAQRRDQDGQHGKELEQKKSVEPIGSEAKIKNRR